MLKIVPLRPAIPELRRYGALIFTSANGVRSFAALSDTRDIPAYAVGSATESALRALAFREILTGPGNAPELADLIADRFHSEKPLLHLAGGIVAADFAQLLLPSGIRVEKLAVYDAIATETLSEALESALYACTISHVLFFSPRTASVFGTLVGAKDLSVGLTSSTALCLSAAVASEIRDLPWLRIAVADRPSSESLLQLLPLVRANST